jgi:TPR repeat protein
LKTISSGDVILDKYEVTGVLGQGGMGRVYAALHRELGMPVALKFLLADAHEKPEIAERFLREGPTLGKLRSDHVARVLDMGTFDGARFMVMEHLTGHDLAEEIRQRGALLVPEAVDVLLQVCEAIHEAHALGIIHRDLKPSNLFVTRKSGALFVKVLDFGIAKSTVAEDLSLTAGTDVLGSPLYMSPEQHAATRSVDARSDVWSLGVVLYEMLAGRRPFVGKDLSAVRAAILRGRYAPLSEERPEIPAGLEEVVGEALAVNRDFRFPSVRAFAGRLAPFGTDAARASLAVIEGLEARPAAPSSRVGEAAAMAAPVGGGELTSSVPSTFAAITQGTGQPASRRRLWVAALVLGLVGVAAAMGVVRWRGAQAASTVQASACADGATSACETECAAHVPGRCNELALALEHGVGAPQDVVRAATLYETECDAGTPAACNSLAALYARGEGVKRNTVEAVKLYTGACNKGYARACVNLGSMHLSGDGVPKNEALGVNFFLRGCNAGEAQGCVNLSIAYGKGQGVPKDPAQAFHYAESACNSGNPRGCARVALAKVTGEGTTKDVKAGLGDLDAMCAKREAAGCEQLMGIYAKGLGPDVPAHPQRFRDAANKACVAGSKAGCDADRMLNLIDTSDSVGAQGSALLHPEGGQ